MLARSVFFCVVWLFAVPVLAATGNSGLPLPRFVSLKNAETNVRTGPGTRYPIQFVYRREHLPVEVIEEFDYWRKIRDIEGSSGWVHKSLLDGKRYALIKGKEPRTIRIDADAASKPILKSEPMVIAPLLECGKDWCRIQLSGRKGWVEKIHLWGVYPEELLD